MNNTIDETILDFKLNRIVFVNSASHAYSEIMLDNHLALFGSNNAGKTASLAATKLMLYPETDFNKCYEKFKFEGKAGQYSKEDSYDFYFPSEQSFLVMEIENHVDTSCVVLYKAPNYQYFRVFLPLAYDEVRALFWDQTTSEFNKDISVKKLLDFQKAHEGIHVKQDKELVNLMYHNFAKTDSRYCIVPLKDNSSRAVKAFKSIYQMAFDAGSGDTSSLADAIATLVDMKRGRAEERMSADLSKLDLTYRQILKNGDDLLILSNNKVRYTALRKDFESLVVDSEIIGRSHAILSNKLHENMASYNTDFATINKQYDTSNISYMSLKSRSDTVSQKNDQLSGVVLQLQKQIDTINSQLVTAKKAMAEYNSLSASTLHQDLKHELQVASIEKDALEDARQTEESWMAAIKSQELAKNRLKVCKAAAKNMGSLMVSQLPAHAATVLVSLNKDFGKIALDINDQDKQVIDSFAELFSTTHKNLELLGSRLVSTVTNHFDIEQLALENLAEIEQLEADIEKHAHDIARFHKVIKDTSGEARRVQMVANANKTQTLEVYIDALSRYDNAMSDLKGYEAQLKTEQATMQTNTEQLADITESLATASRDLEAAKSLRDDLNKGKERADIYKRSLKNIGDLISVQHRIVPSENPDGLELDDATLAQLTDDAQSFAKTHAAVKHKLELFIRDVPNAQVEAFKEIYSLSEMSTIIAAYSTVFATLDYDLNQHASNILEHNSLMGNQLKEIHDAHLMLKDSINQINSKLNGHKISNLKQVRLKLKTSGEFDTVYNLYKSYDISQDQLMSSDFYQSIIKYMNTHADKRTGLIKMRQIIKSIVFEYDTESGETTDRSQSGGTTSTVTASIIAILLDDIFMAGSRFKMPIVIDEIGDLDDANTATIVECIESHGFVAFCAKPTQSTIVCLSVGRWVVIDHNVLKVGYAPLVQGCTLNVMPSAVYVWGSKPHLQDLAKQGDAVVDADADYDTDLPVDDSTENLLGSDVSDDLIAGYSHAD